MLGPAHDRPQRALTCGELAEGVAHVVLGAQPEFFGEEAACLWHIVSSDDCVNETLDHGFQALRCRCGIAISASLVACARAVDTILSGAAWRRKIARASAAIWARSAGGLSTSTAAPHDSSHKTRSRSWRIAYTNTGPTESCSSRTNVNGCRSRAQRSTVGSNRTRASAASSFQSSVRPGMAC